MKAIYKAEQDELTNLILDSVRTKTPILTATNYDLNKITNRAIEIGVQIPRTRTIFDLQNISKRFPGEHTTKEVLIDNVDRVLSGLLGIHVKVKNYSINSKEEKLLMNNLFINKEDDRKEENMNEQLINEEKEKNQELNIGIKDIDIIVPNKVTEVTFVDGTKEKMILHKDDVFNLRNCLFIAIAKHLYKKDYTPEGIEYIAFRLTHLKKYVKIVDSALKAFERKQKDIEKLEENRKAELESVKRQRARRQAYKARRDAKREQTEKEKQIEIQKEAYVRAMKEMGYEPKRMRKLRKDS